MARPSDVEKIQVQTGSITAGPRYRYPGLPGWQHAAFPELLRRCLILGAGQLRNKLQRFLLWGDVIASGIADVVSLGKRFRLRNLFGRSQATHNVTGLTLLDLDNNETFDKIIISAPFSASGDKKLGLFVDITYIPASVQNVRFEIRVGNRVVQNFSYDNASDDKYFVGVDSVANHLHLTAEDRPRRGRYVYKLHILGQATAADASVTYGLGTFYITEI